MTISKGLHLGFAICLGLAACAVGACTASVTTDNPDAGPTGGDGGDSGHPGDSGGGDSGGGDSGGNTPTGVGSIFLTETVGTMTMVSGGASFFKTAPTPGASNCTDSMTMGSCTYQKCTGTPAASTGGEAAPLTAFSVSGGMFAAADATLGTGATAGMGTIMKTGDGWDDTKADSTVEFKGTVGMTMFDVTAAAPKALGWSNPQCMGFASGMPCNFIYGTAAGVAKLSKTDDLALTWMAKDGPSAQTATFSISSSDATMPTSIVSQTISCSFMASAGTGTVPKELITLLTAPGGMVSGTISLGTAVTTTMAAGDFNIVSTISENVSAEDGTWTF
jgi:hypothetical protein